MVILRAKSLKVVDQNNEIINRKIVKNAKEDYFSFKDKTTVRTGITTFYNFLKILK